MARRKGRLSNDSFAIAPINFPTGSVLDFAGSTAPDGWLLCYGQAVSRTDYASLFATLGETYGSGDGSTTFNLPDYRGRVLVGKDDMGGSTAGRVTSALSGITGTALGASGGVQVHPISSGELPSHSHNSVEDAHYHDTGAYDNFTPVTGGYTSTSGQRGQYQAAVTSTAAIKTNTDTHRHTINDSAQTGQAAQTRGSSHQNVQPSIIANKIIKV